MNSSDEKVDLKATPCGKALLEVAGDELLTECQKIGRLELGNLAITPPANLKCKLVFHVRASPYEHVRGVVVILLIRFGASFQYNLLYLNQMLFFSSFVTSSKDV